MDAAPGREPDYRFTLANERTFLAWVRTSLGLLAASVAVVQFGPDLTPGFRNACALVLAVLAAGSCLGGLRRWLTTQDAMTAGRPLERGWLPFVVAVGLILIAVVVAVAEAIRWL